MTNAWCETLWKTNNDLTPSIYEACSSELINFINIVVHDIEAKTTSAVEDLIFVELDEIVKNEKH